MSATSSPDVTSVFSARPLRVLREPNVGHERVAEALAALSVLLAAALGDVVGDRLRRAAITRRAIFPAVWLTQVPEIADARPGEVLRLGRHRALELDDLERKARGRRNGIGEDARTAGGRELQDARLRGGVETGLVAVRERGADLDSRGPAREGVVQALGRAAPACQPERETELSHLREVHDVPLPVDGLARHRERRLPARRGVVPARGGSFDDEPVDAPVRLAVERERERVRRDDRQEERPPQRRRRALDPIGRREPHQRVLAREGARHGQRVSAAVWRTNASRMPGTRIGMPAPMRTAATPASIAP